MAVLGVQIVITMIVASIMSKVGPYMSFARWMLTTSGLIRYMHPSDDELRTLAMIPKERNRKKGNRKEDRIYGKNGHSVDNGIFNVPRNLDIQLETTKVTDTEVIQLRYYTEYQWLVDFAFHAILVYTLTEIYLFCCPIKGAQEVNLSMVWCTLVVGFAYKLLVSLTGLYFEGVEAQGERSLVIVMAAAYLFLAMMILIVQEDTLETGLDEAYSSFNHSAAVFLAENAGLDSSGPASKLVLKFCIALWCSSIGALFTFPGLRMARMQWDALKYTENGPKTVLLHSAFIAPLLLTTLWIKPLSRDYLTNRTYKGMNAPLLTSDQFETMRIYSVLVIIAFRLVMMPNYLQSYLNLAYHKMEEMKLEAGKISNIELQKTLSRVFYYLCVVTLQFVAPMILILNLTLMYKTMGGGSWDGGYDSPSSKVESHLSFEPKVPQEENPTKGDKNAEEIQEAVQIITGQFSLAWQSLKHVFTASVFRGILGFSTWWCCLTWFLSSAIGITYYSYFPKK